MKDAAASGRSLREVAREHGVEESMLDEALDYRAMAKPHEGAGSSRTPSGGFRLRDRVFPTC